MITWSHPKFLLHCHMGGMISPETVREIIVRTKEENLPHNLAHIKKKMVMSAVDPHNFTSFFGKFHILDKLTWHDWAIDLAIQQICQDLEEDGIEYAEISFSINKYMAHLGWTPQQVVQFICESYDRHSRRFGIKVGLLLSLKYESYKSSQLECAGLIEDSELRGMLAGIDLVGHEEHFDAAFYKPIFKEWGHHEKILRCHVGELNGGKDNIAKAITELGVKRIAHGIQATKKDMDLANKFGVYFDVAIHSNIYTGVVKDIANHPLKAMMERGCAVTLNTDDPIQCDCTLDGEFSAAVKNKLIDTEDINNIQRNAVRAAAIIHY